MANYTVTISPKRGGVPQGGSTGQALIKLSNGDWDSGWGTVSGGASAFSQLTGTLALNQTSMNTNKLLGRGTAATGQFEEITLGTNLTLTGTTLDAAGGGGGTPGNPTALVGLIAVNGSATSFMRSDGSPPIDQSISPIWTALHTYLLTNATTSAVDDQIIIDHESSGTVADNFGTSIKFRLESSTTASQDANRIESVWATAAQASKTSKLVVSGVNLGGALTRGATFFGDGGLSVGTASVGQDPTNGVVNVATGFRIANAAASRKLLIGNATNFIVSTETWAVPGSSGNVLTSDGTNWLSSPPTGGGNVSNSGTPSSGQIAQWTSATVLQGNTLSGSGATMSLGGTGVLTISAIANASLTNSSITIGGVSTALGGSALGSVTNDAQTKAAIVPNTAPSAGQILVGNAGGTAYAPVTVAGSGATITVASTGVHTISGIANASLTNSAITIAGTSTSLGGTITQDTITGLGSTGLIKRTAANTLAIATVGTDYLATIPVANTLYVDTAGNNGTAVRGRLDKPYLTPQSAAAAASSGDKIQVGPGTYAFGASPLQLPAGVHLQGAGIDVTKFTTSSIGVSSTHAVLAPGNGSIVSDLTVDASTGSNASPTAPFGVLSGDTAVASALVYRVKVVGNTDSFYYQKSSTSVTHYDCICSSTWDTIYQDAACNGVFEYYNCVFLSDGSVVTGGANASNSIQGGTARIFGGKTTITSQASPRAVRVQTAGAVGEVSNHRVDISGTGSPLDFVQSAGTLNIENCFRSDGAALATSGTIGNLSRALVRDNNLSDIITPATARTNLGLAIGTNVQAWDTDLDTWATLTPSANFQTMVPHTFAQMRTDLGLVIGTNVQAWDTDLDALALSGANAAAQGAILYRGAANWASLAAGTSGQFLKTQGAGADPIWAASAGSGTVTNIATTSPITGGPITTTGTLALDVSVDHAFTAQQSVKLNDATNAGVGTPLVLSHNTTGTPTNGLGTGINFLGETSTTTDQPMGSLSWNWLDVTHATRTSRADITAVVNGTTNTVVSAFAIGIGGGAINVGDLTNPGATGVCSAKTGFRVNNAAASRKMMVGDGTNFIASTETWEVPGTAGNQLVSDGTNWTSTADIDVQKFTATGAGTWTKPTTFVPRIVRVVCIGAGGGGGAGGSTTGALNRMGGGGGGGGGYCEMIYTASDLGVTETLSVGAGGTAGVTGGSGAVGGAGGIGGSSTFGTVVRLFAGGGGGGQGGPITAAATGGGGGGGIGLAATSGAAGAGGVFGGAGTSQGAGDTGSSGSNGGATPLTCANGGSGGGGITVTPVSQAGGTSFKGGGGGGPGTSTTAVPALVAGKAGGNTGVVGAQGTAGGGGAVGTDGAAPTAGTAGTAGTSVKSGQGGGGGGGTITANTAGAAGGAGGACGGGGGGGGCGTNTGGGGGGGIGGRGEIRVYSW